MLWQVLKPIMLSNFIQLVHQVSYDSLRKDNILLIELMSLVPVPLLLVGCITCLIIGETPL